LAIDPETGDRFEDEAFCWNPETTTCAKCGVGYREWLQLATASAARAMGRSITSRE
jgi:hypothetical protein